MRTLIASCAIALLIPLAASCGDDDDANGTATPEPTTQTATATSTAPPPETDTATPTSTPAEGAPAPPSSVTVSGRIPDLNEPVPPGEGEAGRITVEWVDESDDEDGFRIYSEECEQPLAILVEVPADETMHGPLNPCRPARVGVAAFNADGESEIVWAE